MQLRAAERGREGIEPCNRRVREPEHVRDLHDERAFKRQRKTRIKTRVRKSIGRGLGFSLQAKARSVIKTPRLGHV